MNFKFKYLVLFAGFITQNNYAQNIIPNHSFEEIICPDNDYNIIFSTPTWYSISRSDAYWIHSDCPVNNVIAQQVPFLNPEITPYDGKGFMSLEGFITVSGFQFTEGVGIALQQPLQNNQPYYFEMAMLNQPILYDRNFPGQCGDIPNRNVQVHFSNEPLSFDILSDSNFIANGFDNNATQTIQQQLNDENKLLLNKWIPYWDCFIANGNQSHIGITGSFNTLTDRRCVNSDNGGNLLIYGFSIDDLVLVHLPTSIDTSVSICADGGWVNLQDYISEIYFDKANFLWDDGCTDYKRVISEPGIRNVQMELPCITIPIHLDIHQSIYCDPVHYNDTMPLLITEQVIICDDIPHQSISLLPFIPDQYQSDARFLWEDGSNSSERTLTASGSYPIEVVTPCYQFDLLLEGIDGPCTNQIFAPNIFSPNGDGNNDNFKIWVRSFYDIQTFSLLIYDRWGNQVFESTDVDQVWDGYHNGRFVEEAIYTWKVICHLNDPQASIINESGSLLLSK